MQKYDPNIAPIPAEWLELDEDEQIRLAEAYHKRIGARAPSPRVHAVVHVVVENQLAEEIEPVRGALERLMGEGLDRHDAIHAIAAVLMDHMNRMVREKQAGPEAHERYFDDLGSLTVAIWHERYGQGGE